MFSWTFFFPRNLHQLNKRSPHQETLYRFGFATLRRWRWISKISLLLFVARRKRESIPSSIWLYTQNRLVKTISEIFGQQFQWVMDARTLGRVLFVCAKLPIQAVYFIILSFPVLPLPVVFEYISQAIRCYQFFCLIFWQHKYILPSPKTAWGQTMRHMPQPLHLPWLSLNETTSLR